MEEQNNGVPVYTNDDIAVEVTAMQSGFTVTFRSRASEDATFFLLAIACGALHRLVGLGADDTTLVLYRVRDMRPSGYCWRHEGGGALVLTLTTRIEQELGALLARVTDCSYEVILKRVQNTQTWRDFALELAITTSPPNNPP